MNLFIVSSPLTFYFAQSVAREHKGQNYMLKWYMKNNKNHLKSYDLLEDQEIWKKNFTFDDANLISDFNLYNMVRPFKTHKIIVNQTNAINKILSDYNIKEVFISNRYNPFDRLVHKCSLQRGIKVNLLEDGLTNYLDFKYFESDNSNSLLANIKKIIRKNYTKFLGIMSLYDETFLSFQDIYAVYPEKYKIENYTRNVKKINLSSELKNIEDLFHDFIEQSKDQPLYISQTLSEDNLIPLDIEIKAITEFFKHNLNNNERLFIKPHPRDSHEKINMIKHELNSAGIDTVILNNSIPLPLETILPNLKISALIGVWSAVLAYANQLNSSTRSISLLPFVIRHTEEGGENPQKLIKIHESLQQTFKNEIKWIE